MTAAEKAALAWLDAWRDTGAMDTFGERHRATLKAMLAEPRLPAEPSDEAIAAMFEAYRTAKYGERFTPTMYRALYAHLTRPHVDFAALDEARMDDSSDAGASPIDHGREDVAAGGKSHLSFMSSHNCTPAARDDLRAAISVLRGWSAEAAGRTGLADSVLIVCNAAEATLPVQMYRIRAKGLDVVHAGPWSISEVPND